MVLTHFDLITQLLRERVDLKDDDIPGFTTSRCVFGVKTLVVIACVIFLAIFTDLCNIL